MKNLLLFLLTILPCSFGAAGSWNGVAFTGWNGVAITSWNGTSVSVASSGGTSPTPEILWWKFTDGSGTTVTADAGGINGTISGATWITGKSGSGYALQFDGVNDTLSTAVNLSLSGTHVVSIACWVWWDAFGSNDDLLLEFGENFGISGSSFIVNPNDSTFGGFGLAMSDGAAAARFETFTRPSAGAWHHYVFVFDGDSVSGGGGGSGDIKMYVDGTLLVETAINLTAYTTANFGTGILYVFNRANSSLFGAGKLDDFRIYNRDVSGAEVISIRDDPK